MGVDAPEYDRCAGSEAKKRLTDLILGKPVELREEVTEAYGRSMALVYEGSTLVNKVMLEEGWGRPDYRKNSQRDILTSAYHLGQKNKVGFWSFCISSNPPKSPNRPNFSCLIKANINADSYLKSYYPPDCFYYKHVVMNLAYGDQWFCTEKEAKEAGFTKSTSCK